MKKVIKPKVNVSSSLEVNANVTDQVSSVSIKYCNRCEWNTDSGMKDIPEGKTVGDMTGCPECGQDLYEVEGIDDEGKRRRKSLS